jgi:hypothetical protein
MMFQPKRTQTAPSHVCPNCGGWWDAEYHGYDTWVVSPHANDGELFAKVWAERAAKPVCPLDTTTLQTFCIDVNA